MGYTQKRPPALRRHKRPKSKLEEAPMLRGWGATPTHKTIAISGSIVRKGSRTDTKVLWRSP
jgi:hypothetical protein